MSLLSELKRRNVLRMAALYLGVSWLIMQVVDLLIDRGPLPESLGPLTLAVLAVGFPIALIISWFYELTPDSISLAAGSEAAEPSAGFRGRRVDFVIIAVLAAALILYVIYRPPVPENIPFGPPNAVAVLPFVNMSGDPDNEYFSDGLTDTLLNTLTQVRDLKVPARTSAFFFKGQDIDIREIAKKLGVAKVLEGSVQRDGNKMRIVAQLIEAETGFHIWSNTYDRQVKDIFDVQDDIASSVAIAVRASFAADKAQGGSKIPAVGTENISAYDAYLQGRELVYARTDLDEATEHLTRSVRLDDSFAEAHAQLAIAMLLGGRASSITSVDARRLAASHLDRAESLKPDLALAMEGRAMLALRRDPESAIKYAKAALARNPSSVDVMDWLQLALLRLGRYEERKDVLKEMVTIDPLNAVGLGNYIYLLLDMSQCEEARPNAERLASVDQTAGYGALGAIAIFCEGEIAEGLAWDLRVLNENDLGAWAFAMVGEYAEARRVAPFRDYWVDHMEGNFENAIEATQRNLQQYPDRTWFMSEAADILYLAGNFEESLPIYERMLELAPKGRPFDGWDPLIQLMRYAYARRITGDEEGAQAVVQMARDDYEAQRAAGMLNMSILFAEAMIAAFDQDHDNAIAALRNSIRNYAQRLPMMLDDPIFQAMADDPGFIEVREELNDILVVEREKVLQLICFNNPVPNDWQPLPETCEGVVEQPAI